MPTEFEVWMDDESRPWVLQDRHTGQLWRFQTRCSALAYRRRARERRAWCDGGFKDPYQLAD